MTTPSTAPFYDDKEQSPIIVQRSNEAQQLRFVLNNNGEVRMYITAATPVMIDIERVLEWLTFEQTCVCIDQTS